MYLDAIEDNKVFIMVTLYTTKLYQKKRGGEIKHITIFKHVTIS